MKIPFSVDATDLHVIVHLAPVVVFAWFRDLDTNLTCVLLADTTAENLDL